MFGGLLTCGERSHVGSELVGVHPLTCAT
jgi:hypothetical protein